MSMRTLRDNELKTFEQLVSLKQPALKKVMSNFLRQKYPSKVTETKDYIFAEGEIPIALVAHMDTVFDKPVTDMFYDSRKGVIWSPQGLGADDRAGVFAIIQILRAGFRPHVILTTDEEKGCLGAGELARLDCPFEKLQYVIELDRRGTNDCVFYDCENPQFVDYVEQFGFTEAYGSFSDICEFCPEWGVAGVNLSIGYQDEHSYQELLYTAPMLATIEKVKKMLSEEDIPFFKYIPSPYAWNWKTWSKDGWDEKYGKGYSGYGCYSYPYDDEVTCTKCKKTFLEEEVFPVKLLDGKTGWYCPDCLVDNIGWCKYCQEPFEIAPGGSADVCMDCVKHPKPKSDKKKKSKGAK